jgi:hypothetical protein
MKVNAVAPVQDEATSLHVDRVTAGGGGLNLACHLSSLARRRNPSQKIVFVDSSQRSQPVVDRCDRSSVELVSEAKHSVPYNLIIERCYGDEVADKRVIRGPVTPLAIANSANSQRLPFFAAKCVAVVSPKSVDWLDDCLTSSDSPLYFQPTGSLDAAMTLNLARRANVVVTNFDELGAFMIQRDQSWPDLIESADCAPQLAVETLRELVSKDVLQCQVAVTTLGLIGNVVVDFESDRAYQNRIYFQPSGVVPATQNGTGDRWLAEYIYCREFEHLGDPLASRIASIRTCHWLGLARGSFTVDTLELCENTSGRGVLRSRIPLVKSDLGTKA